MAYEMVMPYHLHMPSYFLETFTEYPYLVALFYFTLLLMACLKKKNVLISFLAFQDEAVILCERA